MENNVTYRKSIMTASRTYRCSNPGGPTTNSLAVPIFGSLDEVLEFARKFEALNPNLELENEYNPALDNSVPRDCS